MANAQRPAIKMKVLSAMINDQWYATEWSELLCHLDFGMKGAWNRWTDEMLLRMISTLFCTQTSHLLCDCLIHHTTIWLSVQQNTFLTCTSNLAALITETTSFDNKTQAKSSKRGTKVFHWCNSTLSCPQVYFNAMTTDKPYINNRAVCLSITIIKPINFYHPLRTVTQNMTLNADVF